MNEDTPRTNEVWKDVTFTDTHMAGAGLCVFWFQALEKMRDHARQLEREVATSNMIAAKLEVSLNRSKVHTRYRT
tara:strand:+ start:1443 stop:1667 length:225 start_codon:yes stop_codon:yes gene_type:complete